MLMANPAMVVKVRNTAPESIKIEPSRLDWSVFRFEMHIFFSIRLSILCFIMVSITLVT